ncbi:Gpi16 subunit, GPI transamidase component [Rozella allomycis CSF55]|uniref:Gpi16 subunit, GPI transamidase component n=1 Tax=Rozella allomycis (strain CSF55) TaxID=988480 RepID=A0A4P9YNU5_ROZAC|nr:Gpi16 subunit, GPI transamidase component [Rozella allomycis CSF55]
MKQDLTAEDLILFKPGNHPLPKGKHEIRDHDNLKLKYSLLPREIVCTENLTPWKKLLPCKSKNGFAGILEGRKVFDSNYHSLGIHVMILCSDAICAKKELHLIQTLTVVHSYHYTKSKVFNISFFGVKSIQKCPISEHSRIVIDGNVIINNSVKSKQLSLNSLKRNVTLINVESETELSFERTDFESSPYNKGLKIIRRFSGYGQERGKIKTFIKNINPDTNITVLWTEVVPWLARIYFHTLEVSTLQAYIDEYFYTPAKDRERPATIQMKLDLAPESVTEISYDYTKASLKYTEYPPDPNRGFDLNPGIALFEHEIGESLFWNSDQPLWNQRFSKYVTNTLVLILPLPDFSMPFNVITFTSTLVALFFGSLFNIYTREWRVKKKKSLMEKIRDKLFKAKTD